MGKIIGIDLGTTNSCVAVFEGDAAKVIANPEGNRTTPSAVMKKKTGELVVGEKAKRAAITDKVILSIKRLMGTNEKVELGDKKCTPEEISAMILTNLKETAEAYLGEKVTHLRLLPYERLLPFQHTLMMHKDKQLKMLVKLQD